MGVVAAALFEFAPWVAPAAVSPAGWVGSIKWLGHHHHIHPIDTGANTNFLLPLGDLLFGTLRKTLTAEELRWWGTYEEARRRLVTPVFAPDGTRLRGSLGTAAS